MDVFDFGAKEALEKIAYGEREHHALASKASRELGAGGDVRKKILKGSKKTDVGIRHPWIPTNTPLHAMPGKSRISRLRDIVKQRQAAVDDIAKSIGRGGPKKGARMHRGLAGLGQAQHSYADISSHFDKPVEQGLANKRLREASKKVPGSGFAVSGIEHARSGLSPKAGLPAADLDKLRPKINKADAQAVRQSASFGKSSRRRILQRLQKQHGMSPEAAEAALKKAFKGKAPGRLSSAAGETSRNIKHVKQTGRRAGASFLQAARRLIRK